jgi:N-methylhydantoinase A
MPLDRPGAETALQKVGAPLGWSIRETAQGIIRLADAAMTRALRSVTVARGDDPRAFALFAYGGAGPLHAADIARSLGIRHVVVPPHPGNFCAWGALSTEIGMDFGRTYRLALRTENAGALAAAFAEIESAARSWLESEGVPAGRQVLDRAAECRYMGQDYELAIPVEEAAAEPVAIARAFHRAHEKEYGYALPERPVECVTIRLYAHEERAALTQPRGRGPATAGAGELEPPAVRPVWHDGAAIAQTPVYLRSALPEGWAVVGPAIVEQADATTLIPPGVRVTVDPWHNLAMDLGA